MTYHVSASLWTDDDGKVVIETLSLLNGEIVSFDTEMFGCFIGTAHKNQPVPIADDDQSMEEVLSYSNREPRLILIADDHFNHISKSIVRRINEHHRGENE